MENQRAQSHGDFNIKTKSRFSPLEDSQLKIFIEKYGTKDWNFISSLMSNRNSRQCKERWEKFLSLQVDQSPWTKEEDDLLIQKRNEFGPHWVKISLFFPKRTDVSVKNRWNFLQKKTHEKPQNIILENEFHFHPIEKENYQSNLFQKEENDSFSNLFQDSKNVLHPTQNKYDQTNPIDIFEEFLPNAFQMSEDFFF
jgi:hypothetical protein